MIDGKTVAVVVPAFNEETQIGFVIEEMPGFVDKIVVIDDGSVDRTAEIVKGLLKSEYNREVVLESVAEEEPRGRYSGASIALKNQRLNDAGKYVPAEIANNTPETDRIILIQHKCNSGKGAAISTGYRWALEQGIDCTATMDGDGQMDPSELYNICLPVIIGEAGYVKGNRLMHQSAHLIIPKTRFLGNSVLSVLTKIASGYWSVSDTQTGYSAISNKALNSIQIHNIYRDYGYPNDVLVKLNIGLIIIKEVAIKPVYNIGEKSKMKILKVIPKVSWLLFRSFFKRIWLRYFLRDFHPLFVLYNLSFTLFFMSIPFAVRIIQYLSERGAHGDKPVLNSIMFMFLIVSSMQSLLFAMWMDIQDNERLYK